MQFFLYLIRSVDFFLSWHTWFSGTIILGTPGGREAWSEEILWETLKAIVGTLWDVWVGAFHEAMVCVLYLCVCICPQCVFGESLHILQRRRLGLSNASTARLCSFSWALVLPWASLETPHSSSLKGYQGCSLKMSLLFLSSTLFWREEGSTGCDSHPL